MSDEKVKRTLQEKLSQYYPGEELRSFVFVSERLNAWLEFILLGPIAGAVGARNYYIGLTDKRIILADLNSWTNKPTGNISEIPLGRINKMEQNKGWLNGKLNIHYGEDIKRKFAFNWRQRQNAKNFVDTFGLLPRPTLTDEEARTAARAELAYKEEAKQRVWQAFAVFGLLIILIILCNIGRF